MAAMMRSISSVVSTSGSWRPNLGVVMNSAGEVSIFSSSSRKLKKLRSAPLVEQAQIAFDHFAFHLARSYVPLAQDVVGEVAQVAHVRFYGVRRKAFFQFDVGAVAASRFLPFFRVFGHRCAVFGVCPMGCFRRSYEILHNVIFPLSYFLGSHDPFMRPRPGTVALHS